MFIRGVILAAGKSSRMGKNKLALKIGQSTVVDQVISNVKASKLDEIIVVTGKYKLDTDVTVIHNGEYEQGMSSSVKCGLKDFQGDAVMMLLGDMPFVTTEIIDRLYDAFVNTDKNIVLPICEGKRGNPVVIGKKYFKELLENSGDKGAREIIKNNIDDIEFVEVDNKGIFLDIDDEETYKSVIK